MSQAHEDAAIEAPGPHASSEEQAGGRRGTRLWLFGAALVSALAKTWADAPNALAGPLCCDLYYPTGPWCGGTEGSGSFSCSSGYNKRHWTCCLPGGYVLCWECAAGATCWNGPFECSNYSWGAPC